LLEYVLDPARRPVTLYAAPIREVPNVDDQEPPQLQPRQVALSSDVTDAEWAHIRPLIPPAKRGGGKRRVDMREVVNGVMYVLSTGCQWRYIPKDLPPRSTVNDYFCLWSYNGTLEKIHDALYVKCREPAERAPSPTACIIDSQSVKSAEKGGSASIHMGLMLAS
jgi:transposase